MNPTQKRFSLNRAASRKQYPMSMRHAFRLVLVAGLLMAGSAQAALVGRYTFDNVDTTITGSGVSMADPINISVADASGNGNTAANTATEATPSNPAVFGTDIITGEPGVFGQSHRFRDDFFVGSVATASTTYYVPNGVAPTGANPRTFSLWFNQIASVANHQNKLFGYGTGTSGNAFDVGLEGGGIRIRHFGGNATWGSGFSFTNGGANAGWHHLAVRVNNGASTFANVDMFLDGVQLTGVGTGGGGLTTTLNTINNADGFGIGTTSILTGGAAQNGFKGWLDEFRIYNTALTDSEIIALSIIPEPGSMALALLGALGFAFGRRWRRSS
jgi:hypothetical protein